MATPAAILESSHTIFGQFPTRTLRFAVTSASDEPQITVVIELDARRRIGGVLTVRDIRRVARSALSMHARSYMELRAEGALPGGRLCVERDGDGVYLVVRTSALDRQETFGPIPHAAFSAICRDIVGWSRLLRRACMATRRGDVSETGGEL